MIAPGEPRPPPEDDGAAAARGPEQPGGARRFEPEEGRCELCGAPQLDRHCKVVCPHCGFVRDCSDP